ncbi:MAG: hypothetical protein GXY06_00785 [Clostridiaceae bacterium]|nr:hypothetical protein [Clostridiaceae bacterium]
MRRIIESYKNHTMSFKILVWATLLVAVVLVWSVFRPFPFVQFFSTSAALVEPVRMSQDGDVVVVHVESQWSQVNSIEMPVIKDSNPYTDGVLEYVVLADRAIIAEGEFSARQINADNELRIAIKDRSIVNVGTPVVIELRNVNLSAPISFISYSDGSIPVDTTLNGELISANPEVQIEVWRASKFYVWDLCLLLTFLVLVTTFIGFNKPERNVE